MSEPRTRSITEGDQDFVCVACRCGREIRFYRRTFAALLEQSRALGLPVLWFLLHSHRGATVAVVATAGVAGVARVALVADGGSLLLHCPHLGVELSDDEWLEAGLHFDLALERDAAGVYGSEAGAERSHLTPQSAAEHATPATLPGTKHC